MQMSYNFPHLERYFNQKFVMQNIYCRSRFRGRYCKNDVSVMFTCILWWLFVDIRLLLLSAMLTTIALVLPVVALVVFLLRNYIRSHGRNNLPEMRKQKDGEKKPVVVGFFHPYCNAGGGGERVLWVAIRALQKRYKNCRCVIYTGDTDAKGDEILQRAQQRFNIVLPRTSSSDLQFVFLYRRNLVEAKCYPVLTLLGQSVGSVLLGLEALFKFIPDVYIDSMGYAFTLPLFKYLGGCSVGCYVHYPTISTDMLQKVSDRSDTYNNASVISRSPVLSRLKIFYYKLFAFVYGIAGKRNDFIMVNSTWTFGHIASLWKSPDKTNIVYPPCDVEEFLQLPLDNKKKFIVSLGQFRPEKDHALQIKSFSAFLQTMNKEARSEYKLLLVGGCRNKEDESRVQILQKLTRDLDIEQNVEFRLNVSFKELKNSLAESTIGLHTMWNEHFGIGVVECMAGGVVMLAHDSGGPKLDIVKDFNDHRTGFLASDVDSYAQAMRDIFKLNEKDSVSLRKNARESVERFSESEFEIGFLSTIENEMSQYLN